jgi:hypothetical protein
MKQCPKHSKLQKKKKKKIVSGENLDICNPVLTESTQICNQFMDWSVTLKILSGSRQTNIILLQYDKLPHM